MARRKTRTVALDFALFAECLTKQYENCDTRHYSGTKNWQFRSTQ